MGVERTARLERLEQFRRGLPQGYLCLLNRNTPQLFSSYSSRENDLYEWIGFDGSSGVLAFSSRECILFVDGRYASRAEELYGDTDIQVYIRPHDPTLEAYIKTWLMEQGEGAVIQFDAERWPSKVVIEWQKSWGQGRRWEHRVFLSEPSSRTTALTFADEDESPPLRLMRVQQSIEEGELHLVSCPDDVAWLLQIRADDFDFRRSVGGVVLLGRRYAALFREMSPSQSARLAKQRRAWRVIPNRGLWLSAIEKVMTERPDLNLVVPYHHRPGALNYMDHQRILETIDAQRLVLRDRVVPELGRISKNRHELQLMTEATTRLKELMVWSMNVVHDEMKSGRELTELALEGKINEQAKALGACRPCFPLIVSSGFQTASPHHRPTSRVIRQGDLVMLDMGYYFGEGLYATDATRTFVAGRGIPVRPEYRRIYTAVASAFVNQWAADLKGGTLKASELDFIARRDLNDRRYEGYEFCHGTGHGVGICDHELGITIGPSSAITLREGYVYSLEPGLYRREICGDDHLDFGVRIEDVVVVEKGPEGYLRQRSLCAMPLEENLLDRHGMDDLTLSNLEEYIQHVD